jgi:hypothetical protein
MKMIREEEIVTFSAEQVEHLRNELLRRVSRAELGTLDQIFELSQINPAAFQSLWIQPLLAEGLSFDEIIAQIVETCLWPN